MSFKVRKYTKKEIALNKAAKKMSKRCDKILRKHKSKTFDTRNLTAQILTAQMIKNGNINNIMLIDILGDNMINRDVCVRKIELYVEED